MSSRLAEILESTRARVAAERAAVPARELLARSRDVDPARDLAAALRRSGKGTEGATSLRVIGELKRRSPSAGTIYESMDPPATARTLAGAGVAALSVLTEPRFFGGSLDTLWEVRLAVDLPLLRKDFIVDSYQIVQARAHGADAVLLLAAALSDAQLERFAEDAAKLGMGVLAEAHGEHELARLLALPLPVVGVNARDLTTFEVDLDRALAWTTSVPPDRVVVAESGVLSREDADRVVSAPVDAALVGQGLMRDGRVAENFQRLFGARS